MLGFLLKKSFCDGWDNLFSLVIINTLIIFSGVGFLLLFKVVSEYDLLIYALILVVCIYFAICAMAYGELSAKIANFEGVGTLDFFKKIPSVLKDAILYGLLCAAIIIFSVIAFDYYFVQMQSLMGFFLGCVILWIDISLMLSLMWFIPIRSLMHNNFGKCLKKCIIVFFDNTGFSIFVGIYNLVMIAITICVIGFFPGMTGILIADTNALRLRLYKYDYLEEHPELKTPKERRRIPWEELIFEDREILGPRKLKSFIMPWKDEQKIY